MRAACSRYPAPGSRAARRATRPLLRPQAASLAGASGRLRALIVGSAVSQCRLDLTDLPSSSDDDRQSCAQSCFLSAKLTLALSVAPAASGRSPSAWSPLAGAPKSCVRCCSALTVPTALKNLHRTAKGKRNEYWRCLQVAQSDAVLPTDAAAPYLMEPPTKKRAPYLMEPPTKKREAGC